MSVTKSPMIFAIGTVNECVRATISDEILQHYPALVLLRAQAQTTGKGYNSRQTTQHWPLET